jgi:predicted oxidoreductase
LEVVHVSGKIIPGLYALGEVVGMGQLAGNVLAGGMGNTPPITLGLLLGERLARTN